MTPRSIILGLLGACSVCGLSFLNDRVLRQTYLVGNNMPVAVYGALIVFVVAANPVLRRWRLSGKELTVILALTLAACCVPGAGLLRTFSSSLILPSHYNRLEVGWREAEVLDMVPKGMLVDPSQDPDTVLDGFVQGLAPSGGHATVSAVPWSAWLRPFAFWLPLVIALWGVQIGLSMLFHRQWSAHEHLPYPIATFASEALLPNGEGGEQAVLRSKTFWIAAGLVFALYLNNFLCRWFPQALIPVPTRFDFSAVSTLLPTFVMGGGARLLVPTIYFIVIGIAYLIPGDVSLAFGIGPFLWAVMAGILATYGVNLGKVYGGTNGYTGLTAQAFLLFGANLGVFATLLYTGRHYLTTVFGQAFTRRRAIDDEHRTAVLGCRLFAGAFTLFVVLLALTRIGVVPAFLFAGILVVFFTVMARLIAETGLFYIQPMYHACVILWGLFGIRAIGLQTLLVMQVLTMVLTIDPRESLMPFMTNSLKLLESRGLKLPRATSWCAVAILVGLAVALPLSLYIQYDQGNAVWEGWADRVVPRMPFANITAAKRTLAAQGLLEAANESQGSPGLFRAAPNAACVTALFAGFGLFIAFAVARLRLRWWPLHPLLFVVWGTEPIWRMCGAFLLGWVIKMAVQKYGGANTYNRLKPVMLGLIAGEILGAVFPCVVGAIYYLVTDTPPASFHVLPG